MNTPSFRRWDISPKHPGKVFWCYDKRAGSKSIFERWVAPGQAARLSRMQRLSARSEQGKARHAAYIGRPETKKKIKASAANPKRKERYRKYQREYAQRRRAADPQQRIKEACQRRVNAALAGKTKSASTLVLLGCTIGQFQDYLQCRFQPGMEWNNYGRWQIDHKVPLRAFDLTNPAEQRRAFHYTNCIPMWAGPNQSKSDKIPGELFRAREVVRRGASG